MARLNLKENSSVIFSEITYPPFGYVMSFENSLKRNDALDKRMIEITDFVNYAYDEFSNKEIKATHLPTHLELPGDYRTIDEIYKDVSKNVGHLQNEN